ncbi:MAG: sodium:calcium antiporter [Saprospiraceae bacterium]
MGVSALITPLGVHRNTVLKEIPLSLLGVLVAFVMAFDVYFDDVEASMVSRSEGWVLLAFFSIYLYYMFDLARAHPDEVVETTDTQKYPLWLAIGLILLGLVGLTLGGQFIVENAVDIARMYGISEAVIGITLVSIGTSIPELATSVVAATQRKTDIAVGNVVGSNIFNTFLILGTSATVAPLPLGGITLLDFAVCILATILLQVAAFWNTPKIIYRKEGYIFIGMYLVYLVYILMTL